MKQLISIFLIFFLAINLKANDETDAMGVCPTAIATGNGCVIANYTKEGKMCALYTPNVGSFNIIPYTTSSNKSLPRYGAPEWEGVFAGIKIKHGNSTQFKWLWQLPIDTIRHPNPNNPTIEIVYHFNTNIDIHQFATTGHPSVSPTTILESYVIKNNNSYPIKVEFFYYGFIHPTTKNQVPTLWNLSIPYFTGWDYNYPVFTEALKKQNRKIIIRPYNNNNGQYIAIGASLDDKTSIKKFNKSGFKSGSQNSNFNIFNSGVYNPIREPFWFLLNHKKAWGKNVNWAVKYKLGKISKNGGTKKINMFLSTSMSENQAINSLTNAIELGAETFRNSAEQWWNEQNYISIINNISNMSTTEKNLCKRWTITSRMLVDNQTGAIIASPNRQPQYYASWVRDGIYQALLWETLDERDIVDNYIGYLLSEGVAEDKIIDNMYCTYWRQCYSVQGDPSSTDKFKGLPFINSLDPSKIGVVEQDQMGTFLWALYVIAKHRNPNGPEPNDLPNTINIEQISKIANTVVTQITPRSDPQIVIGKKYNLLQPSFDWYEFPENNGPLDIPLAFNDPSRAPISQSLYTNSAAVDGLLSAYYFTGIQGYKQKADTIFQAIKDNFVSSNLVISTPAYVALSDINLFPLPWFFEPYTYTNSLRDRLNVIAVGWPYNLRLGINNEVIINYGNNIDGWLNTFTHDPDGKCFMPSYLMSAIYDLYKNSPNSNKIDKLTQKFINEPIGYLPENFYFDGSDRLIQRGASPLGWSQAWGALALLAKYNKKLQIFDLTTGINPTTGLVAYYPLNGNANDESGNGFTGVRHGATLTTDRFGDSNKACYFDGIDDYIGLPPYINYEEIGDFTLSLWAKMEAHSPLGRSYFIDFRGDGSHTNNSFYMIVDEVFGESEIHHGIDYTSSAYTEYDVNVPSPIGNWVHFVLLREGDNLKTYMNGNLLSNNFTSGSQQPRSDIVSLLYGGRIGTTSTPTTPDDYWCNGVLDDIRIYNYALSDSTITQLYRENGYGLVAYYPFNGNAEDESGNGNHGIVIGTTLTSDRFNNTNSAFYFNGIHNYIDIDAHANSMPFGTSEVTISGWIKYDETPSNNQVLLGYGGNYEYGGYLLGYERDNKLNFQVHSGGFQSAASYIIPGANTWYHIVGKYDHQKLYVYIDGNLIAETNFSGEIDQANCLRIGCERYGATNGNYFTKGSIDDIRIYNYALSDLEIQQLYNEGGDNPVISMNGIPETFKLYNNYPNPFNPETNIKFDLPMQGFVSLKVYDILGKEIANMVDEVKLPGSYIIKFNGSNLASGLYFYRLKIGNFIETKKMLMIK